MEWMEWNGMEWNGMEWMEWNGMDGNLLGWQKLLWEKWLQITALIAATAWNMEENDGMRKQKIFYFIRYKLCSVFAKIPVGLLERLS